MTLATVLLTLASSAAHAGFGQATLLDGTPEFAGCVDGDTSETDSCASRFYRFLSESLAEQGHTFQLTPVHTSAVLRRDEGVVVGGRLDSFPFGAPAENLSGKPENTQFSPVLPRLFAGWLGGPEGGPALGGGLYLLPPVPVGGASAFVISAAGSAGWDRGAMRVGVEADFTWALVHAPITASEEQFEDREGFSNPDNLDPDTYEAICGASENGCIDTFRVATPGLRAAASWDVGGGFAPYAKAGLTLVNERLYVMYDDTTWGLMALQPGVEGGASWTPLDGLMLHLGTALAYKPQSLSETTPGLFWKLDAAASWRF